MAGERHGDAKEADEDQGEQAHDMGDSAVRDVLSITAVTGAAVTMLQTDDSSSSSTQHDLNEKLQVVGGTLKKKQRPVLCLTPGAKKCRICFIGLGHSLVHDEAVVPLTLTNK